MVSAWSTHILPAANYYILWYLLWSTPLLPAANYFILWYLGQKKQKKIESSRDSREAYAG